MNHIYPDYYKDFRCIADKCIHNCCIGWEIDIDEDTAKVYADTEGDFGQRLRNNIDFSGTPPFFIPAKDERCPFLNNKNLCDIITTIGEDNLCTICAEHPRFHNELPGRIESGLGMCCEEAARIILSKKDRTTLVCESGAYPETDDEIILLRDKVLGLVQDRSVNIDTRCDIILAICGIRLPHIDFFKWAEFLISLERLDENWTKLLEKLRDTKEETQKEICTRYNILYNETETEYEQLFHYITYRHLANAPDLDEAALRVAFGVFAVRLVRRIHSLLWAEKGESTLQERIDVCRMFSAEIEYSDENLDAVLDRLYTELK